MAETTAREVEGKQTQRFSPFSTAVDVQLATGNFAPRGNNSEAEYQELIIEVAKKSWKMLSEIADEVTSDGCRQPMLRRPSAIAMPRSLDFKE